MNIKKMIWLFLFAAAVSIPVAAANFAISFEWYAIKDMYKAFAIDICIFLLLLMLPGRIAALLTVVLAIPYMLMGVAGVLHVFNFRSGLSIYAIHSIYETSSNEALETFTAFFSFFNVMVIIVLILFYFFVTYKAFRASLSLKRGKHIRVIGITLLAGMLFYVQKTGYSLTHANLQYNAVNVYLKYDEEVKKVKELEESRKNYTFADAVVLDDKVAPKKTYVIVIGESSAKSHYSLYGYFRKTTPKLDAMKRELIIFNDVISADAHTVPSLRKTLWFNDIDQGKDVFEARSLLTLFRSAGFKTYWISNQTVNSYGLTGTAVLSGDADRKQYLNKGKDESRSVLYDDVLVKATDEALKDPADKKVIFLHMIGSHHSYRLRYPAEFEYFKSDNDLADTDFRKGKSKKYINEFDNSIRYTDYVLTELIALLKKQKEQTMMIMFSDHGQEVYDEISMRGQNVKKPTKQMYDIPFICWFSDEYKKNNVEFLKKVEVKVNTPFSLVNFPYITADFARISFNENIENLSIFSDNFTIGKRELPEGVIYEDYFKK